MTFHSGKIVEVRTLHFKLKTIDCNPCLIILCSDADVTCYTRKMDIQTCFVICNFMLCISTGYVYGSRIHVQVTKPIIVVKKCCKLLYVIQVPKFSRTKIFVVC